MQLVSCGRTAVNINGDIGPFFPTLCGVRQGDPFSPFLFNMVVDALAAILDKAKAARHIRGLVPHLVGGGGVSLLQYADDTILVMPACTQQATTIKDILNYYATSIGLKINFHKSTFITMNCDMEKTQEIANIFGCVIGKLPFTYLGLPLGTTRPTIVELMPLVCSMERRLTATLNMISYGGKLSLLNSVITSLVIFALCTLRLPTKIIELLDKIRRKCLWTKKLIKETNVTPWHLGIWCANPRAKVVWGSLTSKPKTRGAC